MATDIPKINMFSAAMAAKYKNIIFFLLIIALVGIGIAAFSFYKYNKTQKELQAMKKSTTASQKASSDQLSKILAEVSKIIKLPEGEVPTMATISDVSKLKDQAFFRNSKNGDILLVYNKAAKAILYNPTDKKIVEVAPLSGTGNISSPSPTSAPLQPKVIIRNGTTTPNLAAKIETEVKKVSPDILIVGRENAARGTYDKTIVVVLNPKVQEIAQNITKVLNASVAELPTWENKPAGVDIIIIIGKDKI